MKKTSSVSPDGLPPSPKGEGKKAYQDDHMRDCPVCGKPHFVEILEKYAYRRQQHIGRTHVTVYPCSWKCMNLWDEENMAWAEEEKDDVR